MAEALPISGQIDPKAFPFLLMDLHRHGATGSLKVDGPSYQKALYYRTGRILFGSSNDPRDQLGAILIEEGKLTPEQLEDVNAKVGPGNPLAKILADSGFVSQRELGEAARTKVERILSDIVAYESGSFEFEDGVLPKGAVDLKLSTERLVLASVRRLADRSFVLRHLGGLDVVLEPCAETDADAAEIQAETAVLLSQIDGRRTLKEAASLSPLDEFETAKLACALLFLGIVQKSGQKSGSPARPQAFVAAESASNGLDLAGTARLAFGDQEPTVVLPAPAADAEAQPFFIPESQENVGFAMSEPLAPGLAPEPEPELDPTAFMAPPPASAAPYVAPAAPPPMILPEPEPFVASQPPIPVRGAPPLIPPPSRTPSKTPPPPAVPDIPVPPRPTASRPSKEDLAALDALLNSQATEGPLTPLEKPASPRQQPSWEPKLGHQAVGRRGRTESRTGPILLAVGLVVLAAAGGGWYWYSTHTKPAGKLTNVAAARPTPPPATTLAGAPSTEPTVSAAPSTVPSTLASAATQPPPTLTAPTTTVPAATPAATPTAKATEKPAPVTGAGGTLNEARSLLLKGDLAQAAHAFAANLKASTGRFSVQLLVACSDDTVQKAVRSVQAQELYIVPVNYKGRECYRMCWGLYESEARASSAVGSVPEYFVSGGAKPKVVPTSSILP